MEKDLEGQEKQQHDLQHDREGATPAGNQSWNDEDISVDSSQSEEQQQQNKQVVIEDNKMGQKQQSQNKVQPNKLNNELISMQHSVDHNYLILLIIMSRHGLVNIHLVSGISQGKIHLIGNQSKVMVYALTKEEGAQAIQKISDYIDKISLLKLNIKGQAAFGISKFRQLKKSLRADKIVIFSQTTKQGRQLFMGGQMKPVQLRANSQRITQIKVFSFFLRAYTNKRSYKIIVHQILNTQYMQQAFKKFNLVQYTEVKGSHKARELKVIVGCHSKKDITVYQYQNFMMKEISNFYVLVFCFQSQQKYLQKLKCDKVIFKIVKQVKFNRSYLYVITLKQDFLKKHQEIKSQINKIGDKIIGVRIFRKISPQLNNFLFDKDKYYLFRFPNQQPYSTVVTARRKEGHHFDWKLFYCEVVALASKL